jgi:hypothetical protein
MRRELKEAQKLRDELSPDLDYLKRRLAGENADALLQQRRNALAKGAKASKTAKGREDPQALKTVKRKEASTRPAAKRGSKTRASTARERS